MVVRRGARKVSAHISALFGTMIGFQRMQEVGVQSQRNARKGAWMRGMMRPCCGAVGHWYWSWGTSKHTLQDCPFPSGQTLSSMAAFYHDTRRRRIFSERANHSHFQPAMCEVELLEWSPGMPWFLPSCVHDHCSHAKKHAIFQLTYRSGIRPAEGKFIAIDTENLRTRPQPCLQIVYCRR